MKKDNECNLCGKDRKNFIGLVWYSGELQANLCRGCYLRWCKNKGCKYLEKKYERAKPTTKEWHRKCEALQKAFDKWFEETEEELGG